MYDAYRLTVDSLTFFKVSLHARFNIKKYLSGGK